MLPEFAIHMAGPRQLTSQNPESTRPTEIAKLRDQLAMPISEMALRWRRDLPRWQ